MYHLVMIRTGKILMQIICLVALLFQIVIIGQILCSFLSSTGYMDFSIINYIDNINTVFLTIIFSSIGVFLKDRIPSWKLLFVLSAINLCFILSGLLIHKPMYRIVPILILSVTNFVYEFYLGLNLFRLEENKSLKAFGLALFVNSILWIVYTSFEYVIMFASLSVSKKYMMIVGLLDPFSVIYLLMTIYLMFRNYKVSKQTIKA